MTPLRIYAARNTRSRLTGPGRMATLTLRSNATSCQKQFFSFYQKSKNVSLVHLSFSLAKKKSFPFVSLDNLEKMASYPKKMKLVDDEQQEKGDVKEHLGQKYDTPVILAEEENTSNKEQEMTGLMGQLELIPCKEISLYDPLKKPDEKVPLEELPTVGFPCNCKHILNSD